MDLIGSIKLIENTLGGRYSNQAQDKSAPNNSRINTVKGKKVSLTRIIYPHGTKSSSAGI